MNTIIISPFSNKLGDKQNAKNYPYWRELVGRLRLAGMYVIQLGAGDEPKIGANGYLYNQKFDEIAKLIRNSHLWLSVDNFLHHLVKAECPEKPGIVIWGPSDPELFGYPEQINVLKSRATLRPRQWAIWNECEFNPDIFPDYNEIMDIIKNKLFATV